MSDRILKSIKNNKKYILIFISVCIFIFIINFFFLDEIQLFDNMVMEYFKSNLRNNKLIESIKFLTSFGDIIVFSVILILIYFTSHKKYSLYMAVNLIYTFLINYVLKFLFARTRPADKLIEQSGYSFPSGHAMCSTAFYGLLLYFVLKNTKNKTLKTIYVAVFSLIIILIGFTRIYLNVHYFSDVVVGFILGLLTLLIYIKILKDVEKG